MGRNLNWPGRKTGILTVLSVVEGKVYKRPSGKSTNKIILCRCECGNTRELSTAVFTRQKSCGCLLGAHIKPIDLTGQTFGWLTAVKYAGSDNRVRRAMWLCRCRCGNETEVASTYLKGKGPSKRVSCGCRKIATELAKKSNCTPDDIPIDYVRAVKSFRKLERKLGMRVEMNR